MSEVEEKQDDNEETGDEQIEEGEHYVDEHTEEVEHESQKENAEELKNETTFNAVRDLSPPKTQAELDELIRLAEKEFEEKCAALKAQKAQQEIEIEEPAAEETYDVFLEDSETEEETEETETEIVEDMETTIESVAEEQAVIELIKDVGEDQLSFISIEEWDSDVEEEEDVEELDALNDADVERRFSPFWMVWCFGLKRGGTVISLTSETRYEIFFICSHFGVFYDYRCNEMRFLPGHQNNITCISSDTTGRWVTTADAGEDHVIIVWDSERLLPVLSMYNAFQKEGVRYCTISQDAKYLAASSYHSPIFKFWLWTCGEEEPDGVVELEEKCSIKHIAFNSDCTEQMFLTCDRKGVFVDWLPETREIQHKVAMLKAKGRIGRLTESIFYPGSTKVFTGTTRGFVVCWVDKHYYKRVRIQQSWITSLRVVDGIVVTAGKSGQITFHDEELRLLYWIRQKLDPVGSLSFHLIPFSAQMSDPFMKEFHVKRQSSGEEIPCPPASLPPEYIQFSAKSSIPSDTRKVLRIPSDASLEKNPFIMRDFVFLTDTGQIGYLSPSKNKVRYYLYRSEVPILCIDTNPFHCHFVVGTSHGHVVLYNYKKKTCMLDRMITEVEVTAVKYSPSAHVLAAGSLSGEVFMLDPYTLDKVTIYHQGHAQVHIIAFSYDGFFMAHADTKRKVCLYTQREHQVYTCQGKYISHFKPIVSLLFEGDRFFSIGQDRMIVEYDLQESINRICIKRIQQLELTARAICGIEYPTFYKENIILITNNEYKWKLYSVDDLKVKKTTLGPTDDGNITTVEVLDVNNEDNTGHVVFKSNKYIGLKLIPFTGNPYEQTRMVGHGRKLVGAKLSKDEMLFTIGEHDSAIIMWKVNKRSVNIINKLAGEELKPFVSLIEGGFNGFLFREITDYFYYAQIIHQGDYPTLERNASKFMAVCEIPDLLRAIGYYPSEDEVKDIMYEATHEKWEETGQLEDTISFDGFVKLYLNHRPYAGITKTEMYDALKMLAIKNEEGELMIRDSLLFPLLQERGERLTDNEISVCLSQFRVLNPKEILEKETPIEEFLEREFGIDNTVTQDDLDIDIQRNFSLV